MTRYDAQWPDVHAAEEAQEFTRSITAWDRAQVAAGFFAGVRMARAGRVAA